MLTQAYNHCKIILEAAKLAYANKAKHSITSQELRSWDFWLIANIGAFIEECWGMVYN